MATPDKSHVWTDKELARLEKRIAKTYKTARDDLAKEAADYFAKFEKRDKAFQILIDPATKDLPIAELKKRLAATGINQNDLWNWTNQIQSGKVYTQQDYVAWRVTQMARGERFEAMRDEMAARMTDAKEIAFAYVNNDMDKVFSRNYAWSIDDSLKKIHKAPLGDDWALANEDAIKRLIRDKPDIMPREIPKWAVNRREDLTWGKRKITEILSSQLAAGTSTREIAGKMMKQITDMSYNSAVRAARTAITEAENAGRAESDKRFAEMGAEFKKVWRCTHDGHTRPEHDEADRKYTANPIPIDEPFVVGGEELRYPGDASMGASGWNLYNCRCVEERTTPTFHSVLTDEQRKAANIRRVR